MGRQRGGWRFAAGCWAAVLAAVCGGCATFKLPEALGPGPGAKKAQRREEAVRLFERSRSKAELESARACWDRGDAKGCQELLTGLLARQKDNRDARLLQAEVYLADRRYEEAKQHLDAILATAPKDADALLALAHVLDASGDSQRALDTYRQAAEAAPESEACTLAYRAAREGVGFAVVGDAKETPDVRQASAIEDCAGDAEISDYQRGCAALARGERDEALAAFRRAADREPDNPKIPLQAAAAAIKAGHPDIAVRLLVPLKGRMAGSAEYYRTLGLAHCRAGDYAASEVALQQGLLLDKSNPVSYFLLGCTLLKMGETQRAEECFRQARSLDPRDTARR